MKKMIFFICMFFVASVASAESVKFRAGMDNVDIRAMKAGDVVYQYFAPDQITFSEDQEEIHHYEGDKKLAAEWIYKGDNQFLIKYYNKLDGTTFGECNYKGGDPNRILDAYVRGAFQPGEIGLKKDGYCTLYNADGTIATNKYYADDKFLDEDLEPYNGIYKTTADDGRSTEASYQDGIVHGVSKSYKDGKLMYESEYNKGRLHGFTKHYDENGAILSQSEWKKGKLVVE